VPGSTDPACASVDLPLGANGQVNLVQQTCASAGATSGLCADPANADKTIISFIQGDFTGIYTPGSNASVVLTCANAKCPHISDDPAHLYNAWEESVEDFTSYPVFAQSSAPGSVDWSQVIPCQTAPILGNVPQASATTIPAGAEFCVDVASITRNVTDFTIVGGTGSEHEHGVFTPGPHFGDLSVTVHFLNDPKLYI
jgi:hypothetical protein